MERSIGQSHIMSFVRLGNVYTPCMQLLKFYEPKTCISTMIEIIPHWLIPHILQSRIENMIHKRTTIIGTDLFVILLWRLCELPLYLVCIYITMGILVKTLDYKVRWIMYINRHLYTFRGNQRLITITTP